MPFNLNIDEITKSILEEVQPEVEKDLNKKLKKIYYPGNSCPFGSEIIEVDENEAPIDSTQVQVKQNEIFPEFTNLKSAGWIYTATKIITNIE
jgi:hypothetical protein